MKEAFIQLPKGFHRSTLEMIHTANAIIERYAEQGYSLTLRQLYYQLVARGIIPNKFREYKRLGEILNNARLCGLVDWDAIVDRTRGLKGVNHHEKPSEIVETAANAFRIDKWARQPYRVEVWVEKDALAGILNKACTPLDVDWFSCRGYTSQTAVYDAANRFVDYFQKGQQAVIIHLGDHDPSGMDMTRDIFDRLALMVGQKTSHEVTVDRVALSMEQIIEFHPPPNPAKVTDSRFEAYCAEFGEESWELDAMEPAYLHDLIADTIKKYRDEDLWNEDVEKEEGHRDALAEAAKQWDDVADFVKEPEQHIKLSGEPLLWTSKAAPFIKKNLRDWAGTNKPETIITITDPSGLAIQVTAAQFGKLAGARDKKPKKPSSIKSKKPKSNPES